MVGRAGGGGYPGGCVRASLARETTGALPPLRLPTPSPPHLSKLSPPFSLSPAPHSFFVPLSLSLARLPHSLAVSLLPPRRSFGSSDGAPSPVPSLPSPIPATPSFLYTTSFAVVGEGETPAFAVGEAVLFFPLIKADRCGSGCRDDGTRGREGEWRGARGDRETMG